MSQAEQDLAYVQDIVREAEGNVSAPRGIFFIWALIYFVGFSLYDYEPQLAGPFWIIAGPAGGIVSFWLGRRRALKSGAASRRAGTRHLLHWLGMLVAIFLTVPLLSTGDISGDTLGKVILLLAAFGIYAAGIYLVKPYLWIGIALAVCYLGLLTVSTLPWTAVGVISGGAMLVAGLFSKRQG
jgi:hypothetical protein